MARRDGFVTYTTVCKQYFSMVPGPSWPRFGSIFLVQKIQIFGLCSRSYRSFSISARPGPQKHIWIQILKARASEKFVVKSLNGFQVWLMVMKFQNFHENHEFLWNSLSRKLVKRSDFRRVWGLKITRGPALRAMFKISATSRAAVIRGDFQWCLRRMSWLKSCSMNFKYNMACRDGFVHKPMLEE